MKKLAAITVALCSSLYVSAEPFWVDNRTVESVEVWPNAPSDIYRYSIRVDKSFSDCMHKDIVLIEEGLYQEEAFSLILTAKATGSTIKLRFSRCEDRPVVDRVVLK